MSNPEENIDREIVLPSIVSKRLACPNCGSRQTFRTADLSVLESATLVCANCNTPNTYSVWPEAADRESDKTGVRVNKYARIIKGVSIDFYDIARGFGITDPAIAHALKKLLRYGCGNKSLAKDVDEAIFSLQRWQQDVTTLTNPAPNDPNTND